MRFEELSPEELRVLEGLKEYGLDPWEVLQDRVLLAAHNGRKEVFALNKEALDVLLRMKHEPYFAGLYLGEIKGGEFHLGLEGGALLAGHASKTITVDDKVEQLVLYGRDVFINSILKYGHPLEQGDKCLILNRNGEFLAVGRLRGNIVENLLDKGWYLRKGM